MKLNADEQKAGKLWFAGALGFSVLLSIMLFRVDEMLTHSPREQQLAETLRELRTAQASLPSTKPDERIIRSLSAAGPASQPANQPAAH